MPKLWFKEPALRACPEERRERRANHKDTKAQRNKQQFLSVLVPWWLKSVAAGDAPALLFYCPWRHCLNLV
jgi:hypothetical protein